jgi:UDP-N-acetylglucosamine 2-epimerase (non-hydrolysing)
LFVDHSVTAAAIERFGLGRVFDGDYFRRIPRLRFFDFVQLERDCAFVVTDSGGSQEECYYLDRPCLVHRRRTERTEGLGENVVISELRTDILERFLADPSSYRRRTPLLAASPSDLIARDLESRGFAVAGSPA